MEGTWGSVSNKTFLTFKVYLDKEQIESLTFS